MTSLDIIQIYEYQDNRAIEGRRFILSNRGTEVYLIFYPIFGMQH